MLSSKCGLNSAELLYGNDIYTVGADYVDQFRLDLYFWVVKSTPSTEPEVAPNASAVSRSLMAHAMDTIALYSYLIGLNEIKHRSLAF